MSKTCYRKLNTYKYKLTDSSSFDCEITGYEINHEFIKLTTEGVITISTGYAWDGASGPTRDSISSMQASLVHDALYQMFREELLPQKYVKQSDQLFRRMLVQDGMSRFRAWYWYRGLRLANGTANKPGAYPPHPEVCIPNLT